MNNILTVCVTDDWRRPKNDRTNIIHILFTPQKPVQKNMNNILIVIIHIVGGGLYV